MISKKIKAVSGIVCLSFILQNTSFAAVELRPSEINLFPQALPTIQLPRSVATLGDSHKGLNRKTFILIQDAHTNESAQMNIAASLRSLIENEGIRYVFLEAADGNNSLALVRDKAPLAKREQVAREFLRKGVLDGSEYLDITAGKALSFMPWGVENQELYWKSLKSYEKVAKGRDKFQAYLKQIEVTIETLKPRIFGPSLMEFDAKRKAFLKDKTPLTDYIDVLMKQTQIRSIAITHYPHLNALTKIKDMEKGIDFEKANDEQVAAVDMMSLEDQALLNDASQEDSSPFRIGSVDHRTQKAYYALLEEKLSTSSEYPELKKYFEYLKAAEAIDPKAILEEKALLENEIYDSLIKTEDERGLHKSSEALRFLKTLFNLTVTPEEFRNYKKNKDAFDIVDLTGFLNRKIMDMRSQYERAIFLEDSYEDYVNEAENFYRLTFDRDRAFLENSLEMMDRTGDTKAILITGGYHTPNLTNLLKDKNLSYIVVTPQVLKETNQKKYEDLLLNQSEKDIDITPKPMKSEADTIAVFKSPTQQARALSSLGVTAQNIIAFRSEARLADTRENVRTLLRESVEPGPAGSRMATRREAMSVGVQANFGLADEFGFYAPYAERIEELMLQLADPQFATTTAQSGRIVFQLNVILENLKQLNRPNSKPNSMSLDQVASAINDVSIGISQSTTDGNLQVFAVELSQVANDLMDSTTGLAGARLGAYVDDPAALDDEPAVVRGSRLASKTQIPDASDDSFKDLISSVYLPSLNAGPDALTKLAIPPFENEVIVENIPEPTALSSQLKPETIERFILNDLEHSVLFGLMAGAAQRYSVMVGGQAKATMSLRNMLDMKLPLEEFRDSYKALYDRALSEPNSVTTKELYQALTERLITTFRKPDHANVNAYIRYNSTAALSDFGSTAKDGIDRFKENYAIVLDLLRAADEVESFMAQATANYPETVNNFMDLSMGSMHVAAYVMRLRDLAGQRYDLERSQRNEPAVPAERQKYIDDFIFNSAQAVINVNEETAGLVLEDLKAWRFFGLNQQRIVFVLSPNIPVIVKDPQNPEQYAFSDQLRHPYGHAFILALLYFSKNAFRYNPNTNELEPLGKPALSFVIDDLKAWNFVQRNIDDMGGVSKDKVLPPGLMMLSDEAFRNRGYQGVVEVVLNATGQPGGGHIMERRPGVEGPVVRVMEDKELKNLKVALTQRYPEKSAEEIDGIVAYILRSGPAKFLNRMQISFDARRLPKADGTTDAIRESLTHAVWATKIASFGEYGFFESYFTTVLTEMLNLMVGFDSNSAESVPINPAVKTPLHAATIGREPGFVGRAIANFNDATYRQFLNSILTSSRSDGARLANSAAPVELEGRLRDIPVADRWVRILSTAPTEAYFQSIGPRLLAEASRLKLVEPTLRQGESYRDLAGRIWRNQIPAARGDFWSPDLRDYLGYTFGTTAPAVFERNDEVEGARLAESAKVLPLADRIRAQEPSKHLIDRLSPDTIANLSAWQLERGWDVRELPLAARSFGSDSALKAEFARGLQTELQGFASGIGRALPRDGQRSVAIRLIENVTATFKAMITGGAVVLTLLNTAEAVAFEAPVATPGQISAVLKGGEANISEVISTYNLSIQGARMATTSEIRVPVQIRWDMAMLRDADETKFASHVDTIIAGAKRITRDRRVTVALMVQEMQPWQESLISDKAAAAGIAVNPAVVSALVINVYDPSKSSDGVSRGGNEIGLSILFDPESLNATEATNVEALNVAGIMQTGYDPSANIVSREKITVESVPEEYHAHYQAKVGAQFSRNDMIEAWTYGSEVLARKLALPIKLMELVSARLTQAAKQLLAVASSA